MKLSLYQAHVRKWKDCTECPLHETRRKTVFSRGKLPCDVLFVGEAPGISEDSIGDPFVGPAGILLDEIIDNAIESMKRAEIGYIDLRIAFTNLLCCIPRGENGKNTREPEKDEVMACSERLIEFVGIANPKLIVCVGKPAEKYLTPGGAGKKWVDVGDIPRISIQHPSAILQSNPASHGLFIQRCEVVLADAFEELLNPPKPSRPVGRKPS